MLKHPDCKREVSNQPDTIRGCIFNAKYVTHYFIDYDQDKMCKQCLVYKMESDRIAGIEYYKKEETVKYEMLSRDQANLVNQLSEQFNHK